MPSDLFNFENAAVRSQDSVGTEEKVKQLENRVYLLTEQLRYVMRNLGAENFNEQEFEVIGETIREPVKIEIAEVGGRVGEAEGAITTLQTTTAGLSVRVENAEGDAELALNTANGFSTRITNAEGSAQLALNTANGFSTRITNAEGDAELALNTANGFSTRITNAEGNAQLALNTANGFSTRITNAEGDAQLALSTANGFSTRITNAEGDAELALNTANGFSTRITNVEGAASIAQQTAESITLTVTGNQAGTASTIKLMRGQTQVSSETISFSGLVKFSDLSTAGQTTINGANITTGTISAINITGSAISGGTINGAVISTTDSLNNFAQLVNGNVRFGDDPTLAAAKAVIGMDYRGSGSFLIEGQDMLLNSTSNAVIRAHDTLYIGPMPIDPSHGVTPIIQIGHGAYEDIPASIIYMRGEVYINGRLIT